MVRSLDGIPAVLGACGPNHVNQIRNWAIQTINQVKTLRKLFSVTFYGFKIFLDRGQYP